MVLPFEITNKFKSNLKRYSGFSLLFCSAYIVGLFVFLPDQIIKQRLQQVMSPYFQWQSIRVNNGVWQLRGVNPKSYRQIELTTVDIEPSWWSLLRGQVAADITTQVGELQINGRVIKSLKGVQAEFNSQLDQLNQFTLSAWPQAGEVNSGALQMSGRIKLDNEGNINGGNWNLAWSKIQFQGLDFRSIKINGAWLDDHFVLNGRSEGDVGMQLSGNLLTNLQPKPSSQIDATLNIAADASLPLLAQIFGGNKLQLQLTGPLLKPKASCRDSKACPEWVRKI